MQHFDIIIEKMMFISKHSKDPIIELYQMNKEALKYLSNEKNSQFINFKNITEASTKNFKLKNLLHWGMFSKALKEA